MTETNVKIEIIEIAGTKHCMASQDGEKVFQVLKGLIDSKSSVMLSFKGVSDLTSAFLNTAIGKLYGIHSEDTIRKYLKIDSATPQYDLELLKLVVDRAKEYFKDPVRFEENFRSALGNENE